MIKMLRSDQVWQPKLGAPKGNRNARKHGRRDAGARDLARRIAALRRRAKSLILQARGEVAARARRA